MMTLLQAIDDPELFGPWFKNPEHWIAWRAFIAALFGLKLLPKQLRIYQECTGRTLRPSKASKEAWLVCGRRAGKSFILALIATYIACFHDYRKHLAPGERATVMVIAADRKQARVIVRYVRGLLHGVDMLRPLIERETQESFDLTNRVTIEIASASFKRTRGYTLCAALLDELAFFSTDDGSANPDTEIIAALKPAMATIPGAMLLCASSPYARKGALWDAYKRYFGKDKAAPLVWQAATRVMNPTVPQSFIDEQTEADPANAAAEYGANFRTDIEAFVSREAVEACTSHGVFERSANYRTRYFGFVDPSGGSSDSMTMAIAHRAKDKVIIDLIRERKPPFSPEAVCQEFADVLLSYRIGAVSGDRYAGLWPAEQFSKRGVKYLAAPKPKSDLYLDLLPAINSGRVDLLDNNKLINQLTALERRTARSGKESIDHPPNQHDDVANAVAGAVACASHRALWSRPRKSVGGEVVSPLSEEEYWDLNPSMRRGRKHDVFEQQRHNEYG